MSADPADVAVTSVIPEWTLADRLRKARRHAGMSQAELAEKLGTNQRTYASWESEQSAPRQLVAVAMNIQAITGVPATWLLGVEPTSDATNRRNPTDTHRHLELVPPLPVVHDETSGSDETAVTHPRAA